MLTLTGGCIPAVWWWWRAALSSQLIGECNPCAFRPQTGLAQMPHQNTKDDYVLFAPTPDPQRAALPARFF
jgi:hypothetical protein